jgi:hypothetical protein
VRRRAALLVLLTSAVSVSGCGDAGTDDEPIRYPPTQTLPAPAHALPAWVPERLVRKVE